MIAKKNVVALQVYCHRASPNANKARKVSQLCFAS
jgi:hypothetical protein